ncbi:hypothetical protein GXW74_13500 [Roseomonas eburnea]|uniref:Uncharacterized protein n=1 Tax=Neoroseomonas eburnea TaxID=1346889 RepID=A0A9X9XCS0_9PROT|nr:hypothetical protein [Neoroseomonas eburnea]MBR0681506.1 hypothetical protein [Neoroseomonas eburnea]
MLRALIMSRHSAFSATKEAGQSSGERTIGTTASVARRCGVSCASIVLRAASRARRMISGSRPAGQAQGPRRRRPAEVPRRWVDPNQHTRHPTVL